MVKTFILEEQGLPLFTSSPQTYSAQFEAALNKLPGQLVAVSDFSVGRTTYHLAVCLVDPEAPEAQEDPEAPKATRKSRSK